MMVHRICMYTVNRRKDATICPEVAEKDYSKRYNQIYEIILLRNVGVIK